MEIEVDAILFDNDGVLVDSHEQVDQAWRQLACEFGLDIEKLLTELVGMRAVDTLGRYLPPEQAAPAVARLEDLEVELAGSTQPLAGAIELLDRIPADRWSIVTSASRRLAEARWAGAGIVAPKVTVTAEDVSQGKPHPEPYLVAARDLGVDPTRCVVFEDSASGGVAGRTAGASVVAVGIQSWPSDPLFRVHDLTRLAVREHRAGPLIIELEA